jgi:chorismate mutase / prephenate dehydratase
MSLKNYRKKIDGIDLKIISLLNDRARLSSAIGKEKIRQKKAIYAPDREKEVLDRLRIYNEGPMTADALETIYREIMSSSLSLEKPLKIAYLGTEGSFTYLAATKKFGSQVEYVSCDSIPEVFQEVEEGRSDYGVVPIENSIEGAVTYTFDLLVDSDLKICSQILLKISHHLLSKTGKGMIKHIYSNPQVFGQCRNWLSEHLPGVGQMEVLSTTKAAQMAAKEKQAAAIASIQAGRLYGLEVIASNIQDIAHNTTRFLVISTHDVPATGHDRTSILFSIKDRVGALHKMLLPFARNKINLTKIESRPSKKKAWDYYFFVDFEGHRDDKKVRSALDQLDGMCKYLKILGSYPVSE